jgi:hypothetical protein
MIFTSTLQFARHWASSFYTDVQKTLVKFNTTQNSLSFELLELTDDAAPLACYARDALHYACIAEYKEQCFWEFLLNDTYNLESLFSLTQVDIVTIVLLILERINHYGFSFPTVCYDLEAARMSCAAMTPATVEMLKHADFVDFDFQLAELLEVADAPESPSEASPQELV